MFHTCKHDVRKILEKELALYKLTPVQKGDGWILSSGIIENLNLCFSPIALHHPTAIHAERLNDLTSKITDAFFQKFKNLEIKNHWPLVFQSTVESKDLSKRIKNIQRDFLETITKKMSRVAKLVNLNSLAVGENAGFFVYFIDYENVFISNKAWFGGQTRMKDDPKAPSRSYLKVEEAYGILHREPRLDETVIDLGAAPGGWSYSAAKRGAHVTAVDNGLLIGAANNNPSIIHLRQNAFQFKPPKKNKFDWLFCDMVEDPYIILELLEKWIGNRSCRNFIVNLKLGRLDPIVLLEKLHQNRLNKRCSVFRIRQLYHDREEITLMGSL